MKCPDGWTPYCKCSMTALEPNEDCYWHGSPDGRFCPYCGKFRWYRKPCTHCGCSYGIISKEENDEVPEPKEIESYRVMPPFMQVYDEENYKGE